MTFILKIAMLLAFAVSAFGQCTFVYNPLTGKLDCTSTGSGGSTAPVTFNNTAIATPAVTLTTNGTNVPATNTYGYSVAWYNNYGYTAYQNEVDVDWADPLTGTNSITLHIGTCPVGAVGYIVYRGSPFSGDYTFGLQVQNTCTPGNTVTWTDTGVNDPQTGNQLWSSPNAQYNGLTSWNQTTGIYVPGKMTQGDLGAQTWAFYSGTNPFTALIGSDYSFSQAKNAFVHFGSTANAVTTNLGVYINSTDVPIGSQLASYRAGTYNSNPATTAGDLTAVIGYTSLPGNAGTGALDQAWAFDGHCFNQGVSDIVNCSVFRAQNPEERLAGAGGHTRNMRGFDMTFPSAETSDFPTVSLVGFYSDVAKDKSPDTWQIKMTGNAPNLLGTTTFAGLVPAPSSQGAVIFCSDCTVTSGIDDTCAGSGTGANASYINSVWRCQQ